MTTDRTRLAEERLTAFLADFDEESQERLIRYALDHIVPKMRSRLPSPTPPARAELAAECKARLKDFARACAFGNDESRLEHGRAVESFIDVLAASSTEAPGEASPAWQFAQQWLNQRKGVGDAFERPEILGLEDVARMLRDFAAARTSAPAPSAQAEPKRWPFVETPQSLTDRLEVALDYFGRDNLLGAVRNVFIEQGAALAAPEGVTDTQPTVNGAAYRAVFEGLTKDPGIEPKLIPSEKLREALVDLRAALAAQPTPKEL